MRRIALGALMVLLVAPAESAQSARADSKARASALRLLEPALTVPGVATTPVTTRTTLRKGASYRLVVTGTVTSSFTRPDGVTSGEIEDAFYCFGELNEAAVDPGLSCTKNLRYLGALRARVGGFNDHVHGVLGLQAPAAYQPSHRYVLNFRAPRTGKLSFVSTKLPALSPVGSFKVELYGSAKKKKKRKKRIRGCPAARASGTTVRAARTCHWVVNFEINQSGLPRESLPAPGPGFVDSETIAFGKVFFSAEPRAARTAIGSAAGAYTHIDTYQSPVNPFLFTEGEVKTTPLIGRYTLGRGEIRLRLEGVVDSVTGPVYSQDSRGKSTQPGDAARLQAVYDFPRHRDDTLTTYFGCGLCPGLTGPGDHGHHFVVRDDAVLRVTISRPRSLAGACRCKQ